MLIDDAPFNLIPLEGMLEMKSIQSAKFNNGSEAISYFQFRLKLNCCRRMFRTVLTDISMPEMDGYRVAELIIATEKYFFD
jgi:CheY-like chemotaxis protein